jgi:hypothetical protein
LWREVVPLALSGGIALPLKTNLQSCKSQKCPLFAAIKKGWTFHKGQQFGLSPRREILNQISRGIG